MDITINQSSLLNAVKMLEPYLSLEKNEFPFIFLSADDSGLWVFATNRFTLSVLYYETEVRETGYCVLSNTMLSAALHQMQDVPTKIKTNDQGTGIVISQKGFRLRLQIAHTDMLLPVQDVIQKLVDKDYPILINIFKNDLMRLIRLSDLYPKHVKDEKRWIILQTADKGLVCSTQDTELGKVEEVVVDGTIQGEGRIVVDTEELKIVLRLCSDTVFMQSGDNLPVMFRGSTEDGGQWWATLSQWTLMN